jgi:two-component system nitrate/nitrite response regulator NarL
MAGKKVTPREAEVHNLVYQGKTNKKIAYDLQISEKTVEKYIYSLFQKYEVVSRVQLAVKKAREKNE